MSAIIDAVGASNTLSMANAHRPLTFDEVLGQESIKRFFKNSLTQNKVRSVYMLPGLHGCGKTTVAKILARWLNCENRQGYNPCNKCRYCEAFLRGNTEAAGCIEVDGTSQNNKDFVENNLMGFLSRKPMAGKYNVAIIDEFHRIKDPTRSMFLPFLEFMDVQYPRSVAILCTTDLKSIDKALCSRMVIPGTFQGLSPDLIADRYAEKLGIEPEVCKLILKVSGGSMRQFWMTYDSVKTIVGDDDPVTIQSVLEWVGGIGRDERQSLWKAVASGSKSQIKKIWELWMTSNKAGFDFVATQLLEDLDEMVVTYPDEDAYVEAHQQLARTLTFVNDSRAKVDQLVLGALYGMVLPKSPRQRSLEEITAELNQKAVVVTPQTAERVLEQHENPQPTPALVELMSKPEPAGKLDLSGLGDDDEPTVSEKAPVSSDVKPAEIRNASTESEAPAEYVQEDPWGPGYVEPAPVDPSALDVPFPVTGEASRPEPKLEPSTPRPDTGAKKSFFDDL